MNNTNDQGIKIFSMRMPFDMWKKMKLIAVEEDTTMTDYVVDLIRKDFEKREENNDGK